MPDAHHTSCQPISNSWRPSPYGQGPSALPSLTCKGDVCSRLSGKLFLPILHLWPRGLYFLSNAALSFSLMQYSISWLSLLCFSCYARLLRVEACARLSHRHRPVGQPRRMHCIMRTAKSRGPRRAGSRGYVPRREKLCHAVLLGWSVQTVQWAGPGQGVGSWEVQRGWAGGVITRNPPDQIWCAMPGGDRGQTGMGRDRTGYHLPTFQRPFQGPVAKGPPNDSSSKLKIKNKTVASLRWP